MRQKLTGQFTTIALLHELARLVTAISNTLVAVIVMTESISFAVIVLSFNVELLIKECNNYYCVDTGNITMDNKNYSWKGSPNAGLVLTIVALVGAVAVFLVGFAG